MPAAPRPLFWVAGMRVLQWCMLGATILLLVCEVAISQLCSSLIILLDAFHTLFILLRMALTPPPQTASALKAPLTSTDSHRDPSSSSFSSSSITSPPGTQSSEQPTSPPAPSGGCALSYATCRIQVVGAFFSALLLASLCLAYTMEIIGFALEPHPVQRPLLLVVVSAVALLHKMLLQLWLNWNQQQQQEQQQDREAESHLEVNDKVLAEEEAKGQDEPGRVLFDVIPSSAVDTSLHNGALVLCNPGTSSVPDSDSQTPGPQADVPWPAAAPQDSRDYEVASGVADLTHLEDVTEVSKDNSSIGQFGNQSTSPPVWKSLRSIWRPELSSRCLVQAVQGVCTSLLALINSLVILLSHLQCLHNSGSCSLLVYLDPVFSLIAVIMLVATASPQVHRYGLLLLQATPPHICISDLGRRIAGVPGVRAVHDLHIWQLTESFMVATVHVHCHAGFPAHRCADLMLGVTKVLQSVGVSCCTVQPEFTSCAGSSAGGEGGASPVVLREDPCLPPLLACSLACGKACSANMCCSLLEEESRNPQAPPAGETKEEPQTLVIENTFL